MKNDDSNFWSGPARPFYRKLAALMGFLGVLSALLLGMVFVFDPSWQMAGCFALLVIGALSFFQLARNGR